MVSALKSRLFCGSIVTPLALKKSASVPEVAGAIVTGGGGAGAAGGALPPGSAAAGVTTGWPRACGATAAALGATVTGCATVAGTGSGGCGSTGSAEPGAPAKPPTAATPAAAVPARIRQRRAISFIDVGPFQADRGSSHPGSGADG